MDRELDSNSTRKQFSNLYDKIDNLFLEQSNLSEDVISSKQRRLGTQTDNRLPKIEMNKMYSVIKNYT